MDHISFVNLLVLDIWIFIPFLIIMNNGASPFVYVFVWRHVLLGLPSWAQW